MGKQRKNYESSYNLFMDGGLKDDKIYIFFLLFQFLSNILQFILE